MADVSRGRTFGSTEEVTDAKLHELVDSATVTDIVAADITDNTITDAKIQSVSGAKFTTLSNIPSGAGSIPHANIPTAVKTSGDETIGGVKTFTSAPVLPADTIDAITEIKSTLKSGSDATLITGTKGTSGNLASWNADGDLVDSGESYPVATSASTDEETTGVEIRASAAQTICSVTKTITSGNSVLLMFSGVVEQTGGSPTTDILMYLMHGSTTVHYMEIDAVAGTDYPVSLMALVTGLSGSITFYAKGRMQTGDSTIAKGNLVVLEFGGN